LIIVSNLQPLEKNSGGFLLCEREGIVQKNLLLIFAVPMTVYAACPDGTTPYSGPLRDGVAKNSQGQCLPLCAGGLTSMNSSLGTSSPLFAARNTTPSINVRVGDDICYVDLISGEGAGLNVKYNGATYHTDDFAGCPQTFTLSYDCGDGATGVAPGAREIAWGALFVPGTDYGTCARDGYYPNGWKIDGRVLNAADYYTFAYSGDRTMDVNWAVLPAPTYGIAYTCGSCSMPYVLGTTTAYASAKDGDSVTVLSDVPAECTNYLNAELRGYRIHYADGTDTGDTVNLGEAFTHNYQDNLRLVPDWGELGTRAQYTLTYSCGPGATGTPPSAQQVKYMGLFAPGADYGTCARDGYYPNGWKIDSRVLNAANYYTFAYDGDRVMDVNWATAPKSYGAAYVCNDGTSNDRYLSVEAGTSYTPDTTVCAAPEGRRFAGYEILYADGTPTGDTVASGDAFTFNYDDNIRLSAKWN